MVGGREEEIEGGALDLEVVLKKDKEERGLPLEAVTHLMKLRLLGKFKFYSS